MKTGEGSGMTEKVGRSEQTEAAQEHHGGGHGHSVAAWTSVIVIMTGSLISSVAVLMSSVGLFVAGAVVVVLGAVAGKVMTTMGYGNEPTPGIDSTN